MSAEIPQVSPDVKTLKAAGDEYSAATARVDEGERLLESGSLRKRLLGRYMIYTGRREALSAEVDFEVSGGYIGLPDQIREMERANGVEQIVTGEGQQ